ncbi:MAG: 4Fe-4S dicluster domain-containing protein [Deltaproteobacteria bacterium]|nr:4Fe-4S dicluster domain-containing protein [Deltaproteobacteria bacterium]
MADKIINKADLPALLSRLMDHYRVYAPVRHQGVTNFEEISAAELVDLSLVNTTLSPKSLMLPQSESMFEFTLDRTSDQVGVLREIEKDFSPRIIFGIRPCDAKSFQLLDLNFDTPTYHDPWWVRRRQSTILIGLGCNDPCRTCFCTSVGSGPFSTDGLDILFIDAGDEFAIKTVTKKGEQTFSKVEIGPESSDTTTDAVLSVQESALRLMKSVVHTENLKDQDEKALFEADFWDEVQFGCINCGVCTFVCPTCWCFDIQDEVHKGNGIRLRNWDACMFPLFTLHGSGHNPRAQKLQRVRQRFMHKLKYFVDKYDVGVACVGCGRCVQQCPVNIDIREVFSLMNSLKV